MAGAEKIKERILEEARLLAQENLDQAKKEAAGVVKAAKKEAEQKKAFIIEKAQKEAVERKKRLIAVAELEARKQKLQAKQEMIEETFIKTLDMLNKMPADKYRGILMDMILSVVHTGKEEIVISNDDVQKLGSDFALDVNKKLTERGLTGNIILSIQKRSINGGFILKTGDIEINNSFDAIIRMQHDELETEIVKALF
ncbi:MAG: V-type ATP synthase subunit E [Clostridia bacterium]